MHKKNYNNAEIEILFFDKKDVITASGDPNLENNDSPITPAYEEVINKFFAQ